LLTEQVPFSLSSEEALHLGPDDVTLTPAAVAGIDFTIVVRAQRESGLCTGKSREVLGLKKKKAIVGMVTMTGC